MIFFCFHQAKTVELVFFHQTKEYDFFCFHQAKNVELVYFHQTKEYDFFSASTKQELWN